MRTAVAFRITLRLRLQGGGGPRPELGRPLRRLQLSTFSVTLRTYIGRLLGHLVVFSCASQSENQSQTLGGGGSGEGRRGGGDGIGTGQAVRGGVGRNGARLAGWLRGSGSGNAG